MKMYVVTRQGTRVVHGYYHTFGRKGVCELLSYFPLRQIHIIFPRVEKCVNVSRIISFSLRAFFTGVHNSQINSVWFRNRPLPSMFTV